MLRYGLSGVSGEKISRFSLDKLMLLISSMSLLLPHVFSLSLLVSYNFGGFPLVMKYHKGPPKAFCSQESQSILIFFKHEIGKSLKH